MKKQEPLLPFAVFTADHHSAIPLYKQLYGELRTAILTGRLRAGTALPPTRKLAVELGVSRNTVLGAYQQLFAEGYLEGKVGSATIVARMLPEEMLQSGAVLTPSASNPLRRSTLSKRGRELTKALPDIGEQVFGKPIPFRNATPDSTSFPFDIWARLTTKYCRNPSSDLL